MKTDLHNLRKKDLVTSLIIIVCGLAILAGAAGMPMKGSWGGVQNVWYVSPALFPLFVGGMLTLLGLVLLSTALRAIGWQGATHVGSMFRVLFHLDFWTSAANIRFFAIVLVLFSFVYLLIPRVDFFLSAIFFLLCFVLMFYPQQERILLRLMIAYTMAVLLIGLSLLAAAKESFLADWTTLAMTLVFAVYAWRMMRADPVLKRRYLIAMVLTLVFPLSLCLMFKYMLLVPLPYEGMAVQLMDSIRYWDF